MNTIMFIHDEDHSLLDMDENNKKDCDYHRKNVMTEKKFILDDYCDDADNNGWLSKLIEEWTQEDTIDWLMYAALYLGQSYSSIQHSLAMAGRDLLLLSKRDFKMHDCNYGDKLYDLLHSQRHTGNLPRFMSNNRGSGASNDTNTTLNSVNLSDAESDSSIDVARPKSYSQTYKVTKTKKNQPPQRKLWEFIRDLLRNRETCPSLIRWEDYSQAKFRFVRSEEVAKRWGSRNGNTNMNYNKLSRAMRYYYKRKIFQSVSGPKLVYQFGPNAKGWQTDNPNFSNNN
ncbi:ETS-related transcription factor Elf-5-like [Microplitis mediator]|uniref:ETS-related transcription factor Elf-5-like n=1 Tax=Microplitis mediator TaxID=375433 RepID=UPI002556E92A|nr:ETS-related transcription factor Elf-5-like [Microplitis mediator]